MTYTISEFAKKIGLTTYTLRYYEKEGLLPFIERKNGRRIFKDTDFAAIRMVICLKSTGMPIREIKEYLNLCQVGDDTLEQRHDIIFRHKKRLEERIGSLQAMLELLKNKEKYYQKSIAAGHENVNDKSWLENKKG